MNGAFQEGSRDLCDHNPTLTDHSGSASQLRGLWDMDLTTEQLRTAYRDAFQRDIAEGTDLIRKRECHRVSRFPSIDQVLETFESLDNGNAFAA